MPPRIRSAVGGLVVVVAGELRRCPSVFTSSPVASSRLVTRPVVVEHRVAGTPGRSRGRAPATPSSGCPIDPGGVLGDARDDHGVLGRAEAVDHDAAEARARSPAMSRSPASLPKAMRSGLSASSGRSGRGHHVGERLADVVEVRRAVASYVVEEPGWPRTSRPARSSPPQASAGPQPAITALEWNSGIDSVEHVVGAEPEPLGQHRPGEGDLLVGDPDRLRLAARARGEDQHEQRVVRRTRPAAASARPPTRLTPGRGRPWCSTGTSSRPVEQVRRSRGSARTTWQSALRTSAASASPRRVVFSPTTTRPPSPAAAEQEGHLRGVVHQHADVRRHVPGPAARRAACARRADSATYSRQVQASSPEQQRRAVVVGAGEQHLADRVIGVGSCRRRARGARRSGAPGRWRRRCRNSWRLAAVK